jgi:transcription-repair coupling factor (superfamily II helicase)
LRGAGNLLGDEQSGHIKEVGFELYQSMLEDAILAAKAGESALRATREALSPQITLDAPIMIPEDYVPDLAVRMALYRRMNDAEGAEAVEALAAEMIDRFGPLPPHAEPFASLSRSSARPSRRASPRSTWGPRACWSRSTTTISPIPWGWSPMSNG